MRGAASIVLASRTNLVRFCVSWLVLFVIWAASARAAEVMPPKPARYFNDYAGVVSAGTTQQLNKQLEDFEKATSSQVVVAVFPKMQSDSSIEDYTIRVARSWKVGQQDKNNGAVLFVFVQDRRMRIEAGYGLEGVLPDALCKRIIEEQIKPHFKNNDYNRGLSAGVTAILQAARGEYKGTGKTVGQNGGTISSVEFRVVMVVFFIAFWVIRAKFSKSWRRGTVYRSRSRSNWNGWSGGGWGGGWGGGGGSSGGGSSGGFSGGGGDGGGGGASGSW